MHWTLKTLVLHLQFSNSEAQAPKTIKRYLLVFQNTSLVPLWATPRDRLFLSLQEIYLIFRRLDLHAKG